MLKKWADRLTGYLPTILKYGLPAAGLLIVFLLFQKYSHEIQMLFLVRPEREAFFGFISTQFMDFMTLTFSIIVEALPFVVLGVAVSVLIQVFLPTEKLIKKLPKNIVARRAIISCLGIFMPVCECGNVPVARGLIAKGLSVHESIIFLLTAPSVNIITFIVTLEAFSQNQSIAFARVGLTILIANIAAIMVAKFVAKNKTLTPEFTAYCEANGHIEHLGAGKIAKLRSTTKRAANLFRSEMWLITRLLIIGAMIAAASQVFIPREVIVAIGSNPMLSVAAMLLLAFVISICSSVDAFFALAYVNTFSLGSILAFLVAGPMVDIKMIALMKSTYTAKTVAVIAITVLALTFIAGVGLSYVL